MFLFYAHYSRVCFICNGLGIGLFTRQQENSTFDSLERHLSSQISQAPVSVENMNIHIVFGLFLYGMENSERKCFDGRNVQKGEFITWKDRCIISFLCTQSDILCY